VMLGFAGWFARARMMRGFVRGFERGGGWLVLGGWGCRRGMARWKVVSFVRRDGERTGKEVFGILAIGG